MRLPSLLLCACAVLTVAAVPLSIPRTYSMFTPLTCDQTAVNACGNAYVTCAENAQNQTAACDCAHTLTCCTVAAGCFDNKVRNACINQTAPCPPSVCDCANPPPSPCNTTALARCNTHQALCQMSAAFAKTSKETCDCLQEYGTCVQKSNCADCEFQSKCQNTLSNLAQGTGGACPQGAESSCKPSRGWNCTATQQTSRVERVSRPSVRIP